MEVSILYAVKMFILPPGIFIVGVILGLTCLKRIRWLGKSLIAISILSLYFLSTPYVSIELARQAETVSPLPPKIIDRQSRQAIIVLGGGRRVSMPEYGHSVPYASVLERLRYADYLQQQTKLPILIAGGRVFGTTESEATVMNRVLQESFKTQARWLEENSRNTAQNAANSFAMLQQDGINRIYLVTHALHSQRATRTFEAAGFDVVPAPTIFASAGTNFPPLIQWLPSSRALDLSRDALYELIGQIWYALRYQINAKKTT